MLIHKINQYRGVKNMLLKMYSMEETKSKSQYLKQYIFLVYSTGKSDIKWGTQAASQDGYSSSRPPLHEKERPSLPVTLSKEWEIF